MSPPEQPPPGPPPLVFEEFLQTMKPRLRRLLASFHIPLEDAEDVAQQALLALVYKGETIRDPECWLLVTLKHHCQMYWRTRSRRRDSAVEPGALEHLSEPLPPPQESSGMRCDLESVFDVLPDHCRMLFHLRYGLGYDPHEVAEMLGYRDSSMGKVTSRCREALRKAMQAAGLEVPEPEGPQTEVRPARPAAPR